MSTENLSVEDLMKMSPDERTKELEKVKSDTEKQRGEIKSTLTKLSDDVDGLKKARGRGALTAGSSEVQGKNAEMLIAEVIGENFSEIKSLKKEVRMAFDIKAAGNITLGNVNTTGTASNLPYSYLPGIVTRAHRKITIRDLVPVVSSDTGSFIYYRQPVTGAVGQGSFGFQAGQGNTKALLDKNLQQVIITTDYLAGTARIAKQMMQDIGAMQTFLAADLMEDYRRSESDAFIPQLISSATSFTPAASVTAEKIVQAIADIASRDWAPNGIVCDAATWAKIINTKPSNYSLPGGNAGVDISPEGIIQFLGMPVVIQNNMPAGTLIVGDFTKAAIIQSEGLSVSFFEQDQDNVVRNLVTARVEARVAFAVLRPDAFDYFTAGTT